MLDGEGSAKALLYAQGCNVDEQGVESFEHGEDWAEEEAVEEVE